jgi:hypothetical protein
VISQPETPAMAGARPQEGRYASPQGPAASGAPPHEMPRDQGVYQSGNVGGPEETQRIEPGQPPRQ